jgi:hypothetical protein
MFKVRNLPLDEPPHNPRVPAHYIDPNWLAERVNHLCSQQESLIKGLQRSIPKYVDERLYAQNATSINVLPQSNNLELITTILVSISAAGGGQLVIADRIINFPQGNTTLTVQGGAGFILRDTDTRVLTQGTAGLLGLEMFGIELANSGVW